MEEKKDSTKSTDSQRTYIQRKDDKNFVEERKELAKTSNGVSNDNFDPQTDTTLEIIKPLLNKSVNRSNISSIMHYLPYYENIYNILNYNLAQLNKIQKTIKQINDSEEETNIEVTEEPGDIIEKEQNSKKNHQKLHSTSNINPINSGKLLIITQSGHEIIEFLHLYANENDWNISYVDFNLVLFNPMEFLNHFSKIYDNHLQKSKEANKTNILLISMEKFIQLFDKIPPVINQEGILISKMTIISHFLDVIKQNTPILHNQLNLFISSNNSEYNALLNRGVDYSLKIDYPSKEFRGTFFQVSLLNYLDVEHHSNLNIDYNYFSLQMSTWQLADIRNFAKYAAMTFEIEKNIKNTKNIEFNTTFLQKLYESNEYCKIYSESIPINEGILNKEGNSSVNFAQSNNANQGLLESINLSSTTREFDNQMFLDGASKHYKDLSIILDKLEKGIILEKFERELLGNYAFLLNYKPKTALKKLDEANNRIKAIINAIPESNLNSTKGEK